MDKDPTLLPVGPRAFLGIGWAPLSLGTCLGNFMWLGCQLLRPLASGWPPSAHDRLFRRSQLLQSSFLSLRSGFLIFPSRLRRLPCLFLMLLYGCWGLGRPPPLVHLLLKELEPSPPDSSPSHVRVALSFPTYLCRYFHNSAPALPLLLLV